MDRLEIYQGIIDRATLSSKDESELLAKRGITPDAAHRLKFKSVTQEFMKDPWVLSLPEEIKKILWVAQLNGLILIPFLDPEGRVYNLRPHKLNFPESGSQVYIPYDLITSTEKLVLAESEFKAVASCLMGVPAIGLPGISSFSKTKLPALVDILRRLECREIVVCFDNEIKDDPALPKYKPDFRQRYDTMIYEYIMAYSLKRIGLRASVARLKDSWRVDGKADIDGVLAMKVPHEEYQKLIIEAKSPQEYRKSWDLPDLHKTYIQRRIDKFFYNGPIREENGVYYYVKSQSQKPDDEANLDKQKPLKKKEELTNFTIKIVYIAYGEGKVERFCLLKSKYGVIKEVNVKPDVMVSRINFQKLCYELGDFEYIGSDSQLRELWHYAFLAQDGREINKLKSFGFDAKSKIWFFENGAYCNDKFYEVEDQRIIWVEDVGFMLPPIQEDLLKTPLRKQSREREAAFESVDEIQLEELPA